MRTRWIYHADGTVSEVGGDYEAPQRLSAMVMGDIQPYKSQVTGEMITSRSQHRDHLKAHRLIEVGNETKYLRPQRKELPPGLKERLIHEVNTKLK